MDAGQDLSRRLAAHVAGARFEALPPAAVAAAKRSLLDAIGVSLAASGLGEGCAAFIGLAREGGPGPSTVLGGGFRTTPLGAALANGALAHAMDYEDAYDGAPVHPNAAVVPAALAIAEARGRSGPELIAAVAVGADLVCRLGLALDVNPDVYGWYPPPILSAFGAAAAAASLLRLDAERTLDALSLTLSQATASSQFKGSPHSHVRAVRDAFAAHAGLLAARLAEQGVRGFEQPFEGPAGLFQLYARGGWSPERLTASLGEVFEGANVSFKAWPACRGTHAFIEAALEMRERRGLRPQDVRRIEARIGEVQAMLAEPRAQKLRPRTAIDAKFSIPFTVAAALGRGRVGLDSFTPEALADEDLLSLAALVDCARRPAAGSALADLTRGELVVERTDASRLTVTVEHPKGHPGNPVSQAELEAKFLDCARQAAIPPADPEGLVQAIATLEQAGDLAPLSRLLA
jgi:2-methylcitrate dehydratase PrpD